MAQQTEGLVKECGGLGKRTVLFDIGGVLQVQPTPRSCPVSVKFDSTGSIKLSMVPWHPETRAPSFHIGSRREPWRAQNPDMHAVSGVARAEVIHKLEGGRTPNPQAR